MPKQVAMFIGHVVRKNDLWKAARVRVYKMKLDRFLNMVMMFISIYDITCIIAWPFSGVVTCQKVLVKLP